MTDNVTDKICPKCHAHNSLEELPRRDYRCADCGLELAHLDATIHGTIRGILGWLLEQDTLVNDRYRVTGILGKGGFGVTYLVEDLRLHAKRRALKEVPEILFDEHETRLLGRLSHPSIPDITDRFTNGGMVYLVLEFGGNRTLRTEQAQRGGRIPLFVLLPWMRQLCEALQYLHAQTPPVVHRDLKPDNILLDENGRIMLIDFGIAKESTPDTVTRTLGRAASQGFSPPEQVLGTGTDARSDVYALGAIIYNLLTGQMPPAAHERVVGKTIAPLSDALPDIPPLLATAVVKALELNINLRQQSIGELAQVLALVEAGSDRAVTVSLADIGEPSVSSRTGTVSRLPSVQIPSSRSAADLGAAGTHTRAQTDPNHPSRTWIPILAGIGLPSLLAVAGFWYWQQQETARPMADSPPASTAAHPPGGTVVTPTDAIRATDTDAAPADQPATAITPPDDIGPGVATAAATAAVVTAASRTASSPPQTSAALPSIFSNEQPAPSKTSQPASNGSLLDIFEEQRAKQQASAPAIVEPAAPVPPVTTLTTPVTPTSPAVTPTSITPSPPLAIDRPLSPPTPATKPASTAAKITEAKKVKPKAAASTKSQSSTRPRANSAANNASAWGFQYKGAERKD